MHKVYIDYGKKVNAYRRLVIFFHNFRRKVSNIFRSPETKQAVEKITASSAFRLAVCACVILIVSAVVSNWPQKAEATEQGDIPPANIVINSPYKNYANNYKGNLHAHSSYGPKASGSITNDDGLQTSVDVANWYIANGYNFYALTGHYSPYGYKPLENPANNRMTITPNPLPNNKSIIWMGSSLENTLYANQSINGRIHMGMINLSGDGFFKTANGFMTGKPSALSTLALDGSGAVVPSSKSAQSIVDAVSSNGGFTIINHPYAYTGRNSAGTLGQYMGSGGEAALDTAKLLNNVGGLEINNAGNGTNPLNPEKTPYVTFSGNETTAADNHGTFKPGRNNVAVSAWDEMLLNNKKTWAVANDDGHDLILNDKLARGRGFNIVNSNVAKGSLTKENIIANVKAGNFYASTPYSWGKPVAGSGYVPPSGFYNLSVSVPAGQNKINVSTTNGSAIRTVIGYKTGAIQETKQSSASVTYTPNGYEKYIRFEILNSGGNEVAWSQPVYISVLPGDNIDDSHTEDDPVIPPGDTITPTDLTTDTSVNTNDVGSSNTDIEESRPAQPTTTTNVTTAVTPVPTKKPTTSVATTAQTQNVSAAPDDVAVGEVLPSNDTIATSSAVANAGISAQLIITICVIIACIPVAIVLIMWIIEKRKEKLSGYSDIITADS